LPRRPRPRPREPCPVPGTGRVREGQVAEQAQSLVPGTKVRAVADVAVVVVTLNGLPWLEPCLESVRGYETVLVDHGSTDGTIGLVRERFPEVRIVEQDNPGLAAGWNRGMQEASG